VVSLGNLTVGGTGKTPAVEMVARWLTDEGRRVAIVSRGYGRRAEEPVELVSDGGAPRLPADRAGDEPLLLARRLPGVAVVVGADRLLAGQWTVARLRPDVVLLDDGFQQRRLLKDVEIVCLDARAPWGPGELFPRGTLREPRSALARADLLLATRADARRNHAGLLEEIRHYAGPKPCLLADYTVESLEDLESGALHPASALEGRGVLAFAGIAAPERLAATLTAKGAIVRDLVPFPDHHAYQRRDLDAVARRARAVGASLLVTTEKDAMRLRPSGTSGTGDLPVRPHPGGDALLPTWVLRVRLECDLWERALVERGAGIGEPELAEADYLNAIGQYPEYAMPYWGLGDLYFEQDDLSAALENYAMYLDWVEEFPTESVADLSVMARVEDLQVMAAAGLL
jgi:tetraacyldisaccharide 4'-kinase